MSKNIFKKSVTESKHTYIIFERDYNLNLQKKNQFGPQKSILTWEVLDKTQEQYSLQFLLR